MTQAPPPADMKMQRSSRDASTLPRLAAWLATVLPEGADPVVTLHSGVDSNGMSSETLILDAEWTEDGERRRGEYVAREHRPPTTSRSSPTTPSRTSTTPCGWSAS